MRPHPPHLLRALVIVLIPLSLLGVAPDRARAIEQTTLAVPALSLTFASTFVADDQKLWEQEGLRVRVSTFAGTGAADAVQAGKVDFCVVTAATLVRGNTQGQQLFAIAQLMDQMPIEMVLRKDVADKAGVALGMPIEKRAQALRGRKIAVDGLDTINHLILKYVARKGGLDPDKDLTVTTMQPANMVAAIRAGSVDGFTMGMPYPLMATRDGSGVTLVSLPRGDLPELKPFSFIILVTRPGFCDTRASVCQKMVAGYKRALGVIHENPAQALITLRKKFDKADPAILADSFEVTRGAASSTGLIQEAGLKRAIDLQVDAGVMAANAKVPALSTLYTNKFVQ